MLCLRDCGPTDQVAASSLALLSLRTSASGGATLTAPPA
jgi:hypothetical protein